MRWCGFGLILVTAVACNSATGPGTPAPDSASSAPAGLAQTTQTVSVIGATYPYIVLVPSAAKDHPAPVVIALHGHGGDADSAINSFGLRDFAQKHGCIVIAPSAREGWWHDQSGDPMQPADLALFKTLLDKVPQLGGDPNRVYVIGHSNGGGMAHYLAATFPDRIAGVVAGSARIAALDEDLNYHELPAPKQPISVLMVHGMQDEIVGYDMRTFSIPAPDAARWWAQVDNLPQKPRHQSLAGGKLVVDTYGDPKSTEVVLMTYRDMGHSWATQEDRRTGVVFNDAMWDFMSRHQLKQAKVPGGRTATRTL